MWSSHDDVLKEVSKQFPQLGFTLYGEGETLEDIWVAYFCSGSMQVEFAEIIYPPMDPKKMK